MPIDDKIKCPKCGTSITVDQAIVQKMVDIKVKNQIEKDREQIEEQVKKEYSEIQNKDLSILKEKLFRAEKEKQESIKKELEFIKKEEEFTDKLRKQDLIIAQKLKERQISIEDKIRKEEIEKNQFLIAEMRKQLEDTKKALTDAQRKAQQGSMQTQGEVVELSLENLLKENFPTDEILPVPKGISGADIVQKVINKNGQNCGIIIWESKQTKNWTEDWIGKLKDDGRNIKANTLILVSDTLPKIISSFGIYKGVWVTKYAFVIGLTYALRNQLIAVNNVISTQENKEDKKEILYNYLTSQAFSSKIESLVENFANMKTSLDKEKLAMTKIWSTREVQLNRMLENTAKIYGEIQGVAGNKLPSIEIFELESGPANNNTHKPLSKSSSTDNNQENLF